MAFARKINGPVVNWKGYSKAATARNLKLKKIETDRGNISCICFLRRENPHAQQHDRPRSKYMKATTILVRARRLLLRFERQLESFLEHLVLLLKQSLTPGVSPKLVMTKE